MVHFAARRWEEGGQASKGGEEEEVHAGRARDFLTDVPRTPIRFDSIRMYYQAKHRVCFRSERIAGATVGTIVLILLVCPD